MRVDAGYEQGESVPPAFDSLLAKLVVTGATRTQALQRARRALADYVVEGMPTVIPFHRAVVADPAFATDDDTPFSVHTRWIETDFDNTIEPYAGPTDRAEEVDGADGPRERVRMTVEVDGRRLEVVLPAGFGAGAATSVGGGQAAPRRRGGTKAKVAASGDALTSPMQGTIVKCAVEDGQQVAAGDLVVVLEAMKMEQPLTAHKAGTVTGLAAQVGATVASGTVLCEIKD